MNQTQKRILSILAAAAMTVCAVPQSAPLAVLQPVLTASAETDGDYAYEDDADGTGVKITKYNSKIKNELGWKPEVSMIEAVTKTVDWYLANQEWVENLKNRSKK